VFVTRGWALAAILLVLAAGGCGLPQPARPEGSAPAPAGTASGFPLRIRNDDGREVTLPSLPRRIVSLAPAHTETLFALGVGDRVVAADTYSDYPPAARIIATLNCWPRPPVEPIVALAPDLVLVLTQDDQFLRQMEAARIPALRLFPKDYEQALAGILLLGRVTGKTPVAESLVRSMRERSRAVETAVRGATRKRVLFELDAADPTRPYVAGRGGIYGALLRMAGGENVFADLPVPAGQVSAEQVVARDPAVILLGDSQSPVRPQRPEMLRQRPGWAGIRAVRTHQVFPVVSERITRPGPRLVEGLEEIARRLHPDRYRRSSAQPAGAENAKGAERAKARTE
jgi:iron complex transport system substrate-binding protein